MNERLGLKGHVTFEVKRPDGTVEVREVDNSTTNAGFAAAAGLLNGVVTNFFEHIAVGTGSTGAAAGNTALGAELSTGGLARASGTCTRVTTTQANDTAQIVVAYTVAGTAAVTESGLFDSAASGVMLARQTFSAINVVSGDTLTVTWKVKVA